MAPATPPTLRITIEAVDAGGKRKTLRAMEIREEGPGLAADRRYHVVAIGETAASKRSCSMRGPGPRAPWGPWKIVERAIQALDLDLEGP